VGFCSNAGGPGWPTIGRFGSGKPWISWEENRRGTNHQGSFSLGNVRKRGRSEDRFSQPARRCQGGEASPKRKKMETSATRGRRDGNFLKASCWRIFSAGSAVKSPATCGQPRLEKNRAEARAQREFFYPNGKIASRTPGRISDGATFFVAHSTRLVPRGVLVRAGSRGGEDRG